jgi:hypothetical protein
MEKGEALFDERTKKSDHDALVKVWKELKAMSPSDIARNAIAEYDESRNAYTVQYLNRRATVLVNEEKLVWENGEEVFPPVHLLILHYLTRSREIDPTGDLISFRELDGGNVYYAAFEGRSIRIITQYFGDDAGKLLKAGEKMGAEPFDRGHASIRIHLFPRVPIYIVVWEGDDEMPASSNFLFDSTIRYQVHTEDVAVICSILASRLRKSI